MVQSRLKFLMFGIGLTLILATQSFAADEYTIDNAHTSVGFSVRHLVISNVKGVFKELSGSILYDEKEFSKSSVQVTIQVKSIDTGNQDRDTHVKNPDFLDVEKYPEIAFKSSKIEKQKDKLLATGTLSLHGVSKEVQIPFTMFGPIQDPWGKTRFGVEGKVMINRQDYGITWSKTMDGGGLMVGNDIEIELVVEAVKK